MTAIIREFRPGDAAVVNRVALAAWDQYRGLFSNWARSEAIFANAASLADKAELLVAEKDGSVVGCVVYVGPGREREDIYDCTWSIIRALSVDPCSTRPGNRAAPLGGLYWPRAT
jgi:hypothetical protein